MFASETSSEKKVKPKKMFRRSFGDSRRQRTSSTHSQCNDEMTFSTRYIPYPKQYMKRQNLECESNTTYPNRPSSRKRSSSKNLINSFQNIENFKQETTTQTNKVSMKNLISENKVLKEENRHLKERFEKETQEKEKSMNKMKGIIQKNRLDELEKQNKLLKRQLLDLQLELEERNEQKDVEKLWKLEKQNEQLQKILGKTQQSLRLKEAELQKAYLQMNYHDRRVNIEFQELKRQKEVSFNHLRTKHKQLKERFSHLRQEKSELEKKNVEFQKNLKNIEYKTGKNVPLQQKDEFVDFSLSQDSQKQLQ